MTKAVDVAKIYNEAGETYNYQGRDCKKTVIFMSPAPVFLVNLYLRY